MTALANVFAGRLGAALPTCTAFSAATFASALTVAANWVLPLYSFPASFVPTAGGFPVPMQMPLQGVLQVPPGWAITLVASTAWGANTTIPSMGWIELPA